jgi:vancomycin resistance protein YoaR
MVNVEETWSLDMRFTNTTGNWIAVVVEFDGINVTATIRGTHPGWTVQVFEPTITEVVRPETRTFYTESPELARGQELQVEHAQEGFTATVHRVVTGRDGEVLDDLVLTSTYAPSRNTILRGTGDPEA